MTDVPSDFLPDLRDLRSRPELGDSLWREPYLVEHTYRHLAGIVRSELGSSAEVLDLGCGLGYQSLELARDGCRVLAIDADAESIDLARGARDADPALRGSDRLSYEVADMAAWRPPDDRRFDVILASRVLHHVADLDEVLDAAPGWLRPGGRIVAVEFAYDRFDRRCATWLHQMQGLLEAAGCPTSEDVRGGVEERIARIWEDWWQWHEEEHELHTFERLAGALRGAFTEVRLDWLPYHYWEVLRDVELSAELGPEVARFLREMEEHLIGAGLLPAVLFAWVGELPDGGGEGRPQENGGRTANSWAEPGR